MTDLREFEAESIRGFIQYAANNGYLSGRVLDYGCGKQPYRGIVEDAGGEYLPFDRANFPANLSGEDMGDAHGNGEVIDAILCTQVLQYVTFPRDALWHFRSVLGQPGPGDPKGYIVATYPTNWPEVELEDLHRFTKSGMEKMLIDVGFEIVHHIWRHGFQHKGVSFACGYGVIARA